MKVTWIIIQSKIRGQTEAGAETQLGGLGKIGVCVKQVRHRKQIKTSVVFCRHHQLREHGRWPPARPAWGSLVANPVVLVSRVAYLCAVLGLGLRAHYFAGVLVRRSFSVGGLLATGCEVGCGWCLLRRCHYLRLLARHSCRLLLLRPAVCGDGSAGRTESGHVGYYKTGSPETGGL